MCLEDVLARRPEGVFKMSSEDKDKSCLQDIFKTYSPRQIFAGYRELPR